MSEAWGWGRPPKKTEWADAKKRLGATPVSQARWLLEFATRNLQDLPAEAWLPVQWEATAFIEEPETNVIPRLTVGAWQSLIYDVLDRLRKREEVRWPTERITYKFVMRDGRLVVDSYQRTVTFAWWTKVREVLTAAQTRFRFCARDDCRRPLIAWKRQTYCSRRCSQTARTRKHRAKAPERVRLHRRESYQRGKRRKLARMDAMIANLRMRLNRFFYRVIRDRDERAEIIQDVLWTLRQRLTGEKKGKPIRNPEGWAFRVAYRKVKQAIAALKTDPDDEEDLPEDEEEAYESWIAREVERETAKRGAE